MDIEMLTQDYWPVSAHPEARGMNFEVDFRVTVGSWDDVFRVKGRSTPHPNHALPILEGQALYVGRGFVTLVEYDTQRGGYARDAESVGDHIGWLRDKADVALWRMIHLRGMLNRDNKHLYPWKGIDWTEVKA